MTVYDSEKLIMMIHEITNKVPKHKARKRLGRGHGSGVGKTSGRGHKGAGSRAGFKRRPGFEGGQMSLLRRIPKRGFTNFHFRKDFYIINVALLNERFEDGATVDIQTLIGMGLVRDTTYPLKVLGHGELKKKLTVTAGKCSESARAKIEAAGGTVTILEVKKWKRDRSVPTARKINEEKSKKIAESPAKS
jgi:large subunit ribosomal protein L15